MPLPLLEENALTEILQDAVARTPFELSPKRSRKLTVFTAMHHRMDAWGVALIVASLPLIVHDLVEPSSLLLVLAITAMYAFAYALNDYFDAPYDAYDARKSLTNPFVYSSVSRRTTTIAMCLVLGFLVAVFSAFSIAGLASLALFLAVAWGYSSPPLRLKSRPGIDLLTHAVFVQSYPYAVMVLLIGTGWVRADSALVAINFLGSLTGQLAQQVRDFEVDSRTDSNLATAIGRGPTRFLLRAATAATMLTVAISLIVGAVPLQLLPLAIVAFPRFALRFVPDRAKGSLVSRSEIPVAIGFVYTVALLALSRAG